MRNCVLKNTSSKENKVTVLFLNGDEHPDSRILGRFMIILMEYITMCLDSTNILEHWYVRHNNVYCLHLWATCFNLYTGHLQALLYV